MALALIAQAAPAVPSNKFRLGKDRPTFNIGGGVSAREKFSFSLGQQRKISLSDPNTASEEM